MAVLFAGKVLIDQTTHPMSPGHWIYLNGWMSNFVEVNPGRRRSIIIARPLGPTGLEIEVFYPETVAHVHVETAMPNFVEVQPAYHPDPDEEENARGFKPPVGEA